MRDSGQNDQAEIREVCAASRKAVQAVRDDPALRDAFPSTPQRHAIRALL